MEYNFREIEKKWQDKWVEQKTYQVTEDESKKKFYVLNMFPYPSGAGLHVGHPLGYIASDIYARYKRLLGFNVLNPMGYDAYGLPAEQYAIQTGQHPAITTVKNLDRYREQLDKIGFSFDWSREIRTCEPNYYKWTQWAFQQMFNHYFDNDAQKAISILTLVAQFEKQGTEGLNAAYSEELSFTAQEWKAKTEKEQQEILLNYRIAYLGDTMVNWCPALGTVLANDEVVDGVSERGGHPVIQKVMRQWCLRVSAYAQRLLDGLNTVEWTDSLKETQRNWIGRSEGAEMQFKVKDSDVEFTIFTTRADTVFGVTFMVLAPESELVAQLTSKEQEADVQAYIDATKKRTERERISDRRVTGVFSGSYAINPLTKEAIPVYISDYVLAGYGTGAIMAVPAHDSRDYAFAKHFKLDSKIRPLVKGCDVSKESFDAKEGIVMNSPRAEHAIEGGLVLNGLTIKEAIAKTKLYIKETGLGKVKINFRLRDAIFSRQRYWGEPFPVYYKEGMPYMLDESKLPLELPEIDKFLPTESGEPPLGRAQNWKTEEGYQLELNTMPGFAGSSAYYLRYMDPHNNDALVSKKANEYWENVDLYVGGTEHATGHLIYARFWNKFLFDLGTAVKDEPFQKLINQGMIQGRSNFVYRIKNIKNIKLDGIVEIFDKIINNNKNNFYKNYRFSKNQKKHNIEKCYVFKDEKTIVVPRKSERKIPIPDGYKLFYYKISDVSKELKYFLKKTFNIIEKDIFETPQLAFASYGNKDLFEGNITPLHVDVNIVSNDVLDLEAFKNWNPEYKNAQFILEDGKYVCGWAVEKMSKSMFNVVNPDMIVDKYGADTLRMYEMFLGPVEQSKPWDTNGIDGVHRFIRKFWALFYNKTGEYIVKDEEATKEELKSLHKLIKKVTSDIEQFSYNTSVSAFMICVNELTSLKCYKKEILEQLVILLAPFAPHISEELWETLGNGTTVCDAQWPVCSEDYLKEDVISYTISFNGKARFNMDFAADADNNTIQETVLASENAKKWIEDKAIKKIIIVPKKIVNIVL